MTATLKRPGFYPAGGGRVEVAIEPGAGLARLDLLERGALRRVEARAMVAGLPGITDRLRKYLQRFGLDWARVQRAEPAGAPLSRR